MATIQSNKLAIQYGQHYVPVNGNPIPGVIAVGPVAAQPDNHYAALTPDVHHQHHPQQQQHQSHQSIPAKPIILNHSLNNGGSAGVNHMKVIPPQQMQQQQMHQPLQQQHHQLPQQQLPTMWLLVEWEMPAGEPSTYSAIDSSELVLHSPGTNTRETIHTGKTIFVKRGKKVQQATVVIISDDKQFIDTELRQLRKMAAENHHRNLATSSQDHSSVNLINSEQHPKRRRVETVATGSDELEPASPEYEPMPIQSQVATANWVNSCKLERVISPSPSVMSVHVTNAVPLAKPPPMTFDQQTQTDTRFFPQENSRANQQELTRMLSLQETILAEQKSVRMENEYNRKMMFDMMEQLSSMAESLKQVVTKVDSVPKYEITEVVKSPADHVSNYVVLGTGGEESRDRPPSIADSVAPHLMLSNGIANNMTLDTLSHQDDSNMSFNQSKFSVQEDTTSSAASTPKNLNFSKRLSSSALSLSNISVQSQGSNATNNNKSTVNEMLKDWNDEEGDEMEMTTIGPNNTLVKKQILRAINWTNYKAATRKLLMTLFTREMLASHTLTGRPSPAFMGDRAKPVKDKLDQKVITDIIAIVTKTCNVSEPMVRTAITTKCADENKMSRMKSGKAPQFIKSKPQDHAVTQQNQSPLPTEAAVSPPVITYQRRVKRENKENVH